MSEAEAVAEHHAAEAAAVKQVTKDIKRAVEEDVEVYPPPKAIARQQDDVDVPSASARRTRSNSQTRTPSSETLDRDFLQKHAQKAKDATEHAAMAQELTKQMDAARGQLAPPQALG
jgi:hypothetical protein